MIRLLGWAGFLGMAVIVAGCATGGQKFKEMSSEMAAPPAGMGRIYFYRTSVFGAAVQPEVKLNGEVVGKAVPQGFFYADCPPGDYTVTTATEVEKKLTFTLDAGQVRYVRLAISLGVFVGHVYGELVDGPVAANEMESTSYTGSVAAKSTLTSSSRTLEGEEIRSAFEATPSTPAASRSNAGAPEGVRPAAAGVAVTAAAGTGWVRVGDRWKYRLNYTGRGVGTVNVEIRDVNGSRVTEQITLEGFKGFRTERDVETKFEPTRFQSPVVFPGGYQLAEIAPYFPPGTELKEGQVWTELPGDFALQHIGKRALLSNARVVGKERVNVPAGQFEAWRVESLSEATSYNGAPLSIVCSFWYAPTMSRAVRVSVTTHSSYAPFVLTETYDLATFERAPVDHEKYFR
jgi:hypothetical protein